MSYLSAATMKRPSSSCISLFSSKLLSTGRTFLSAFSIPSNTRTRPFRAARTALYIDQFQPNIKVLTKYDLWSEPYRLNYACGRIASGSVKKEESVVTYCIVDENFTDLVHIMDSGVNDLSPLLEIHFSGVSWQANILHFPLSELTEWHGQVSPGRAR